MKDMFYKVKFCIYYNTDRSWKENLSKYAVKERINKQINHRQQNIEYDI